MAQTVEYPMFSPNDKAKLYKRLTNDMPIKVEDGKIIQVEINGKTLVVGDNGIITVQGNRYVYVGKFRWIDDTSKQDTVEQPIDGLIIPNSYITIKTNSLKTFNDGDVIELPKPSPLAGLWIVTDGKTSDYIYTPKQVQTYQYLPLSSVGIS